MTRLSQADTAALLEAYYAGCPFLGEFYARLVEAGKWERRTNAYGRLMALAKTLAGDETKRNQERLGR